jgi:hypothetical protein
MNAFTDRRSMLLGALTAGVAATVVANPAVTAAETPDAIFALVEAHKVAWERFMKLDGSDHKAFTAAAGGGRRARGDHGNSAADGRRHAGRH